MGNFKNKLLTELLTDTVEHYYKMMHYREIKIWELKYTQNGDIYTIEYSYEDENQYFENDLSLELSTLEIMAINQDKNNRNVQD